MRYVWEGCIPRTPSGLTKKELKLNARGKVVSFNSSERGRNLQSILKRKHKLAEPFTSASAKRANSKSLAVRRAKRRAFPKRGVPRVTPAKRGLPRVIAANIHPQALFEDYYDTHMFR